MNETEITQILHKMHGLQPKRETLGALRGRVFAAIDEKDRAVTRTTSMFSRNSISVYASAITFVLVLVAANQLPMHSTYERSISSVVALEQTGDTLEKSSYPAADAQKMQATLASTRATLDQLKLKGEFAAYSQSDCLHAYVLYDGYLDYLGDYLKGKIQTTKDPATIAAYKDLALYVEDSHQEALHRINMYPSKQQ